MAEVELPHIDDDIWPEVSRHAWKYRRRTLPVTLIELHATRSGIEGRTPLNEYHSTINWALSAGNINPRPPDTWGSIESFVCGGGKVARVLADDVYPHYGLGHADPEAIAIEIGQANDGEPFDLRDLDNAARICAHYSVLHDIPVKVLPWLSVDNREAPGYVRHDRSANGRYLGKSDPGESFNDRAFEARVRSYLTTEEDEEDMYRIIKIKGDTPASKTYLWRPGQENLHMKSKQQREQTAKLYDISDQPVLVDQATLEAL